MSTRKLLKWWKVEIWRRDELQIPYQKWQHRKGEVMSKQWNRKVYVIRSRSYKEAWIKVVYRIAKKLIQSSISGTIQIIILDMGKGALYVWFIWNIAKKNLRVKGVFLDSFCLKIITKEYLYCSLHAKSKRRIIFEYVFSSFPSRNLEACE